MARELSTIIFVFDDSTGVTIADRSVGFDDVVKMRVCTHGRGALIWHEAEIEVSAVDLLRLKDAIERALRSLVFGE